MEEEGGGKLDCLEMKKEKCLDFHTMACTLSDSLLESGSRVSSHAGAFVVDSSKTT